MKFNTLSQCYQQVSNLSYIWENTILQENLFKDIEMSSDAQFTIESMQIREIVWGEMLILVCWGSHLYCNFPV